jgi:hypothetical protein
LLSWRDTPKHRGVGSPSKHAAILREIKRAFRGATMPTTAVELAEPGLDGAYVVEHFLGRSAGDVDASWLRPSLHLEDFTYMTPQAVAYYLPPVLRLMLIEPHDAELWIFLSSFLRHCGPSLQELTAAQRRAIAAWADFLREQWEDSARFDPEEAAKVSRVYSREPALRR